MQFMLDEEKLPFMIWRPSRLTPWQIWWSLSVCETGSLMPCSLSWSCWCTHPIIFTALHAMQTRSSDENSVRLSVCLSVTRVILDKMEEDRSRFIYHTKEHLSHFSEKKNGWWRATPYTWNFGSTDPRWRKIADFQPIIARSSSAVTPSEKVQLTLIGSPLCAFQWA